MNSVTQQILPHESCSCMNYSVYNDSACKVLCADRTLSLFSTITSAEDPFDNVKVLVILYHHFRSQWTIVQVPVIYLWVQVVFQVVYVFPILVPSKVISDGLRRDSGGLWWQRFQMIIRLRILQCVLLEFCSYIWVARVHLYPLCYNTVSGTLFAQSTQFSQSYSSY